MARENIEKMIYDETEKRLEIMESDEYVFPDRAGRADYIVVCACVAVSIVLIILCILGVII